jgi:hypothetical protein
VTNCGFRCAHEGLAATGDTPPVPNAHV